MTRPLEIPAMANVHSHAFQRGLRGVAERPPPDGMSDDFWGWREAMYALARSLDVDRMRTAGRALYAEMANAGYGAVGEFHYVHHNADGTPYEESNAMATALAESAREAGLEIVLLPAAYGRGGWDRGEIAPSEGQRRFCDPSVDAFLERLDRLRLWAADRQGVSVGVAAHSVRAVPSDWLVEIARYAETHGLVRHVHAHEQPRELEECFAEHGCSPIELLERTGFLGAAATVVHAIHVEDRDVRLLAESGAVVASCPTTEGSLGDGVFPAMRWHEAGVRIAIGSDSQVIVDPFEEVRELETLARRERGGRSALLRATGDLWGTLVANGRASLGLSATEPSRIRVDLDHPRLAGVSATDAPLAIATCAGPETLL